jgi:L-ascorbate 6-phosphate lactonase
MTWRKHGQRVVSGCAMETTGPAESLSETVRRREVPPGCVVAWWLGGAGFIFKTPAGQQLHIDPYLSNVVEDIFGQARAFPPPLSAEEARPDLVICSHWHEDHLDPGAIPVLARNNPSAKLLMPPSAMARAVSWGVPRRQITPVKAGQTLRIGDVGITAIAARHNAGLEGWEVVDALCFILEIEGTKIFFSGDTEYDTSLRRLRTAGIDVAFLCMNGVGGNMNAHEAAFLGWQMGVRTLVPMHHYLWKDAGGGSDEATLDPKLVERTYRNLGGKGRVIAPTVAGEIVLGA